MLHNFRTMRQKKDLTSRACSLVINDELIRNLQLFTNQTTITGRHQREGPPPSRNGKGVNSPTVNRQLDVRFETIYFQVAMEVFDTEPQLRPRVLASLTQFADRREDKFSCDRLIVMFLQRLLEQIKADHQPTQCSRTYAELLEKSNQNIEDRDTSQESLKVFISVWAKAADQELRTSCEHIVKTYISRCLTAREYTYVYNVFFDMFDARCFEPNQAKLLQEKLLLVLQGEDLRGQFLKGMFKHLLAYLCVNENARERWEQALFDVHFEALKMRYKNLGKRESKKNGFAALSRWIELEFVSVAQLVTYSRNSLLCCFVFNLAACAEDKDIVDAIVQTYFEFFAKCDQRCRLLLLEVLFDQIYDTREAYADEAAILIRMAKRSVEQDNGALFEQPDIVYGSLLRPLPLTSPLRTQLDILVLDDAMLNFFPQPFPNTLLESLCELLFSLYSHLQAEDTARDKYFLTCSILTLLRKLQQKGENDLLQEFLLELPENRKTHSNSNLKRYMQRYIVYEMREVFGGPKILLPEQMRKINIRIHSADNKEILSDIDRYFARAEESNPVLVLPDPALQMRDPKAQKKADYLRKEFERCRRQTSAKEQEVEIGFVTTGFEARRRNSIMSYQSSHKADQSFQGIFGLLHEGRKLQDSQNLSKNSSHQ